MNRYLQALLRHFSDRPDAVFCRQVGETGETVLTWADLEADCGRFAAAYRAAGLAHGDQVLIFLRQEPALYGAFFGAMLSGIAPAFMPCTSPRQDPALYWASHEALLRHIRPAAIVTDRATLAEMAASALPLELSRILLVETLEPASLSPIDVPETEIGLLQHSSGTTGLKKGVALTFEAIVAQVESYATAVDLTDEDAIVSWLPLYHDMGLIACLVLPAYFAVPVTHLDPFHWIGRPDTLFDRLVQDRGTLTWLPNFAFEHLSATAGRRAGRWDLSGVRAFINCSEPCKAATFDRFASAFAPAGVRRAQLQCCYAMAETVFAVSQTPLDGGTPLRVTVDPASLQRGGTPVVARDSRGVDLIETGQPIAGVAVSIHDEHGDRIDDGRVGEIGLGGAFLFAGYNRDPTRTAERIRDGVYLSRDLGFMHVGRLFVLGRMDDLIIVNGRNLYAHEVEAEVSRVAGVKSGRSVALAWFDDRIGSQTLVIVAERAEPALRPDADIRRDISVAVNSVFNVVPRAIELLEVGQLIKTSSGKVSRSENLRRYIERLASARPSEPREAHA